MRSLSFALCAATLSWAGSAGAQAPPTVAPAVAPAAAPALYFDRAITEADLKDRSLRELSLMRNTIFARAGNPFRKPWLDKHFSALPWYKKAAKADLTKVSQLDWDNSRTIAKFETAVTPADLQARATAIQARVKAGTPAEGDDIELHLISARLGKWMGDEKIDFDERSPLEDPSLLDRQLKKEQLDTLSLRELRILRNTIFARHGYKFKSTILTAYFEMTDWYKVDPAYTAKSLTRLDWRNVKLVRSVEDAAGGPMTDGQHLKEDEWLFAA